mgnify:CR=1 FL=1
MTPEPAPSRIFRKVSLERLSSPEQLDSLMRATDPQGWLALVTIGVLLALATTWATFATIPSKVEGTGILLRGHGMQEVFTPVEGVVREVYVKPGDVLEAGQSVGFVLEAETYRRMREVDGVLDARRKSLSLAEPGDRTRIQAEIDRLQGQRDEIEAGGRARGLIQAPFKARVVELLVDRWDWVSQGTHVLYVEPVDMPLVALLYVSAGDAGRITAGMPVQIFPDSARREEYGCMVGRIEQINLYPSSGADLQRKFGNDQLVAALVSGRTPVQATVNLLRSDNTPSGYAWSTRQGPSFQIRTGTLCSGAVIIGEQHPINLVMP